MSRSLSLLFAMLGIAMIMWPGGASAQFFDDLYDPPPGYGSYDGSLMGYRGPREPPSCRVRNGVDYGGRWEICLAIAQGLNGHRIDYECDSFCILKINSRNVCVTRDARLGFHGVSFGGPNSQNINREGNAMFLKNIPARIAARVRKSGALNSKKLWYMSGSEAISLGIRECS